jgi:glycosyltransferase involved in cell wall biosynthesis
MTRKRRILFTTVAFEEGGGERLYVNLLNGLTRDRFDTSLLAWKVHDSHFVDELPADVPLLDLGRVGRWRTELPRLVLATARAIRRIDPDVVVAITTELTPALYAAIRLSGRRPRVILDEQGSPSAWLPLVRDRPWRERGVRLAYSRLPRDGVVICVSESVREDLITAFGCNPARLVTIPNPVDVGRVRRLGAERVELPWPDRRPIIVSVGRFFRQKGFDVLARAFVEVARETDARLLLVAEGPERANVEQILADAGLADRAALVGYQANPFPFVAAADVFALPSLTEGFGFVLVEAMALGVAPVSSSAAGPRDILDGGRYGTLVPPGDHEALARELLALLRDGDRRERMGQAARERAETYAAERVVAAYEEVLDAH